MVHTFIIKIMLEGLNIMILTTFTFERKNNQTKKI
jgi:hypothetical protein